METTSNDEDGGGRRLSAGIAIALALLGLIAAVIAWRIGTLSTAAGNDNVDGLAAIRARNQADIESLAIVARTHDAWLDYERNRQRASALDAAGLPEEASNYWRQAVAHWELIESAFLDPDGDYASDRHLEALQSDAYATEDLEAGPHFEAAEENYRAITRLTIAGVITALALPFFTLAEVFKGRHRLTWATAGAAALAIGLMLTILGWS